MLLFCSAAWVRTQAAVSSSSVMVMFCMAANITRASCIYDPFYQYGYDSAAMKLVPVILSGGSGTRLWPLSRELLPKQLLALTGERTMLQETAARLVGFERAAGPIVVCNEAHRFLVAEQLREMQLEPTAILLEPAGRNTAPAIALAARAALAAFGEDILLLVLPADHTLSDLGAFQAAIRLAVTAGESGQLVAFGIVAKSPE